MKALVITGSRADRNGLEVVHEALLKAGHESTLFHYDGLLTERFADVAIVGGDRIEILEAAVELAALRIPIVHIAGGDVTEGSADNRYRNAITALSCIHLATNEKAEHRLRHGLVQCGSDDIQLTGSPAIDRIKQTIPEPGSAGRLMRNDMPNVLVSVHPNTVGGDPCADTDAVIAALKDMRVNVLPLEPNADPGSQLVTTRLAAAFGKVIANRPPAEYYWLMQHCDVMIGNSSAMLYEAPCFGLRCVLVGERQAGRTRPLNIYWCRHYESKVIADDIMIQIAAGRLSKCENPYGDGHSAPRIVKALEENAWRWSSNPRELEHALDELRR